MLKGNGIDEGGSHSIDHTTIINLTVWGISDITTDSEVEMNWNRKVDNAKQGISTLGTLYTYVYIVAIFRPSDHFNSINFHGHLKTNQTKTLV